MTETSRDRAGGHQLSPIFDSTGMTDYCTPYNRKIAKRFTRREMRRENRQIIAAGIEDYYADLYDEQREQDLYDAMYVGEMLMDEYYDDLDSYDRHYDKDLDDADDYYHHDYRDYDWDYVPDLDIHWPN